MPAPPIVAVVGGGPGGLMAAERLAVAGASVTVFEQMPSVGRKFLLAGRGGLNLTHSEPTDRLVGRYGPAAPVLGPLVEGFDSAALRSWAAGLGESTFVGSSGRVFPESFRATPLLRAWLARLHVLGVEVRTRQRWTGFTGRGDGIGLSFTDESGVAYDVAVDAVVLALGGASWPKVGSDGAWVAPLSDAGVGVAPLRPANCGFVVPWTEVFRKRFGGVPLKNVGITLDDHRARGEAMITDTGIEGGVMYAIGSAIRDVIEREGSVDVRFDLHPDLTVDQLRQRLGRSRTKDSVATVLRKAGGLAPVAIGLMREATGNALPSDLDALAALVKDLPVRLVGVESVERAISTAGGVRLDELDDRLMIRRLPGVFVAGEMLDWEAPTGGYLLQATFSTAVAAADGVVSWLARPDRPREFGGSSSRNDSK